MNNNLFPIEPRRGFEQLQLVECAANVPSGRAVLLLSEPAQRDHLQRSLPHRPDSASYQLVHCVQSKAAKSAEFTAGE